MSEQYDLLKSILLEKSVRTGTFTLASGKVSDLYVDCRMTALDPVGATLVGALGWKLVKEDILPRFPEVAAIGGMTMGADPISLAVGMTSALEGAERRFRCSPCAKNRRTMDAAAALKAISRPGIPWSWWMTLSRREAPR